MSDPKPQGSSSTPNDTVAITGLADEVGDRDEDSTPTVCHAPDSSPPLDSPAPDEPIAASNRYTFERLLGEGGMGSVLRVHDAELNRNVAMKVLKPRLLKSAGALARFREEAQIAAQLQHPGIIPVHDIGRRPDGSVYFTMKEVKGQTFEDVIDEVQIALEEGRDRTESGWSFRRLIDVFHRVCETVAYAHHRGVVHRDLKPENIMVGAFGEVLVLDWGLAKVLSEEDRPDEEAVMTDRSLDDSTRTRVGSISGTPAYMAPEQARGQIHKIGPTTDVYALGGILYAILSGRTPYMASDVRELLDLVAEGAPIDPPSELEETPGVVPLELETIAMWALMHRQDDRYAEAGQMAKEVAAWLDGARRREKAREVLAEARRTAQKIDPERERATKLDIEAAQKLEALPDDAALEAHYPAWELEAEARRAREQADLYEREALQGYRSALSHAPDLEEATDALTTHFHRAHKAAEARGDTARATELGDRLAQLDTRGRFARYLQGDGAVTLVTDPPGAHVALYEMVERHKQVVPEYRRSLGTTPLREVSLPRGSWMLEITAPGRARVRYPLRIERLQHWDGIPPGESEPFAIRLPEEGELGADDCYVPAGWFWTGSPDRTSQYPMPRQRIWVDGMVFKRFPVTMQELLDCVNAHMQESGSVPDALVPEYRGHRLFRQVGDRWELGADPDGDAIAPDWPVCLVPWEAAQRYATWLAARTKAPWRLPHELEWRKAASGADERPFSWGFAAEPLMAANLARELHSVAAFPHDESPYGLRHCVGGVIEMTRDEAPAGFPVVEQRLRPCELDGEPLKVLAVGGAWSENLTRSAANRRKGHARTDRAAYMGMRLCRPV